MKLKERDPYHTSKETLARLEIKHNAKYLGCWCIKDTRGNWSEMPVEVFYQPNPKTELGHSHYFGIFFDHIYKVWKICDAKSAFSEPIIGIVENDIIYVSRYRHDFVETPSGIAIDGGRDYTKIISPDCSVHFIDNDKISSIKDAHIVRGFIAADQFIFHEITVDE